MERSRDITRWRSQDLPRGTALLSIGIIALSTAFAQIDGGDFENLDPGCTYIPVNGTFPYNYAHFQTGCTTTDWWVSHGTPEISYSFVDHWASLWGGNFNGNGIPSNTMGEGLFLYCDFQKDRVYKITFSLSSYDWGNSPTTVDNVRMYLANGISQNNNTDVTTPVGSNYLIPNIPDKELVWNLAGYSNGNWTNHTAIFMPSKDYTELWIYPEDNDFPIAHLHIDDVVAVDCPVSQVYTNTSALPTLTGVSSFITANNSGGPVNVTPGQTVHFRAGGSINLLPGFYAQPGSVFTAMIENCGQFDCATGNTFTGGGGQRSVDVVSGTTPETMRVFPNPAEGVVNITIPADAVGSVWVRLMDLNGRTVRTMQTSAGSTLILDTGTLTPGIYLVQATSENMSWRERLVIR